MYSSKLFAVALGFLTVLTSAAPTSLDPSLMSKDWSHVFAPGHGLVSTIEPGSSMASISIPDMAGDSNIPQIRGEVRNHCSFSIWACLSISPESSAPGHVKCDNPGETPMIEVKPGGRYKAPFPCQMNQCGHVIKLAYHPADRSVYQIEYSADAHDGRMWYNLSAEDGAPFQDIERYLGGRGPTCPFVHCAPGQWGKDAVHGCDWPIQPLCDTLGSVVAVLCGRL
ncbi:hypothetical protein G6011_07743 [Alternaria panax]|uniref:Uncharacterized protein n=1 Tax=Alternaria panax TaxID=48097 RepID=A0AAD4F7G2_9PLEO|nr:hypothetical protein G6011_07743 [Alternaria panax]